jgi:GT2 family glycosyltransferase
MIEPRQLSVVIPNWNGEVWLRICLPALARQTLAGFEVIVVDNGSTDGSLAYLAQAHPEVHCLCNAENRGFSGAVNQGIRAARGEYVALLNNDTEPAPDWLERLAACMDRHPNLFSVGSKMLCYQNRDRIDDAGDGYTVLGFAFRRGDELPEARYRQDAEVFTVCAGAALYRKDLLLALDGFAESFFAYVEDVDLGWRARRAGYRNWFCADSIVWHIGSASSGSRYNPFKIFLTNRNNLWLLRRNLPWWLLCLAAPLVLLGLLLKTGFYACRGQEMAGACLRALWQGVWQRPAAAPVPGGACWHRDLAIWAGFWRMTGEWALLRWHRYRSPLPKTAKP